MSHFSLVLQYEINISPLQSNTQYGRVTNKAVKAFPFPVSKREFRLPPLPPGGWGRGKNHPHFPHPPQVWGFFVPSVFLLLSALLSRPIKRNSRKWLQVTAHGRDAPTPPPPAQHWRPAPPARRRRTALRRRRTKSFPPRSPLRRCLASRPCPRCARLAAAWVGGGGAGVLLHRSCPSWLLYGRVSRAVFLLESRSWQTHTLAD